MRMGGGSMQQRRVFGMRYVGIGCSQFQGRRCIGEGCSKLWGGYSWRCMDGVSIQLEEDLIEGLCLEGVVSLVEVLVGGVWVERVFSLGEELVGGEGMEEFSLGEGLVRVSQVERGDRLKRVW